MEVRGTRKKENGEEIGKKESKKKERRRLREAGKRKKKQERKGEEGKESRRKKKKKSRRGEEQKNRKKGEEGESKGNQKKKRNKGKEKRVMSEAFGRDYQVCEEIGRGRFGTVFRCVSVNSGDSFASKSIAKLILADDSIDCQCIDKEAKIMQLVSGHSNIVQIFDVYEDDTHLEIILELCSSSDLFDRIADRVFS